MKVPLPVSEFGCTAGGNMRQGFILGIGTNVDPERNARRRHCQLELKRP